MRAELTPPIRVGVIGAGYFGQFHYDAWSRMDDVSLVAICELDAGLARKTAERFGDPAASPQLFADAAEMMRTAAPDIVDITAPPAAHLPLIEALAPFAPRIVCQKPFCGGTEGARKAIALAEANGFEIAVHENIRFQPWNRELKRLLDQGAVGAPYQISFRLRPGDGQGESAYLDRQPYFQTMPKFLVHETAVHWIDTFRYLFGEASGVFARLARLNPAIAGEDAGVMVFDFASGARGLFDGNRLADHIAENRRRTMGDMLIEGSEAVLRLDGEGRIWRRAFGSNDESEHMFQWRDHLFGGDCVHACCRHILDAWKAGHAPETRAQAYLRNQEIEDVVYDSAETGRYLTL